MIVAAIFLAATLTQFSELDSAIKVASLDCRDNFCVTGTVTYVLGYHEALCHIVLDDGNLGVDIHGSSTNPPQTGDVIRIEGCLMPRVATSVKPEFRRFEILAHQDAPAPVSGTAAEIMSGIHDFRRAYLVGEVRDVEPSGTDPCWNYISIISEGNQYYAPIPIRGANLKQLEALVGSTVRLDGFPDSHNCSYRFLDERRFMVADLEHISVLTPPAENGFPLAPSIDSLHRLPAEKISRLGRHKASGRLLTIWQSRHALLELADKRIAILSFQEPLSLKRGETVEVIGYPATDGFTLRLSRAIGRPIDGPSFTEPAVSRFSEAHLKDLFTHDYYGKSKLQGCRIQVVGTLADFRRRPSESGMLQLVAAGHILDVDCSSIRRQVEDLAPGCRLRVTGTCVLETENWSSISDGLHLNGIQLVIDKPDDFEILAQPPWWTPARLVIVVATLLVALIAFILWNRTLSRLSEKRGHELFEERTAHAMAELKTEERTRLAVELHDSISQILTGAAMQLDAGETNAAKRILASCRRELRSCLWDLRSNAIDAANLADAIRETLTPHLSGRKLIIDLNIPSSSLSEELRHAALRIVREAAANAIRHGHASLISISGEFDGRRLTFSIVDDGRGFDTSVANGSTTGHFGILGMRERAKSFNGSINIASTPGDGTEVSVVLEERTGYDFGEDTANAKASQRR